MPQHINSIQGDIYKLNPNEFDAAIVFVKGGFNGLDQVKFDDVKKALGSSSIGYLIYRDGGGYHPEFLKHKAYLTSFKHEEDALCYIREKVNESLNLVASHAKRIAFHGIQIYGLDTDLNTRVTVDAVKEWLSTHEDTTVTFVDLRDSFAKYITE